MSPFQRSDKSNDSKNDPGQFVVRSTHYPPSYLSLYKSGEMQRRADSALHLLKDCRICPWDCGVDRTVGESGKCHSGRHSVISSYFPHHGEEDCIRGFNGSGAIFFSLCNLGCVFCENYEVSHDTGGWPMTAEGIASVMLQLQEQGCHNINFVTPSHMIPQILEALPFAIEGGLEIPLIYNSSGYDSRIGLQLLEGVFDIYMPDIKFYSVELGQKYTSAPFYFQSASIAVKEMYRQVGDLLVDEKGLARKGVLLRHLILPGQMKESQSIIDFVSDISTDMYIHLIGRYRPDGHVGMDQFSELNRKIHREELENLRLYSQERGLWRIMGTD